MKLLRSFEVLNSIQHVLPAPIIGAINAIILSATDLFCTKCVFMKETKQFIFAISDHHECASSSFRILVARKQKFFTFNFGKCFKISVIFVRTTLIKNFSISRQVVRRCFQSQNCSYTVSNKSIQKITILRLSKRFMLIQIYIINARNNDCYIYLLLSELKSFK